jgi:hypothetical protein
LLWDNVSALFPSVFTIVRVQPLPDLVAVLVTDPAGFVTVCVLTVVPGDGLWIEFVLTALGLFIGVVGIAPIRALFLFRCAANGIQTSMPAATTVRILLCIWSSLG